MQHVAQPAPPVTAQELERILAESEQRLAELRLLLAPHVARVAAALGRGSIGWEERHDEQAREGQPV